jgi:DUF4097 and DUF4098 domain-containing protein YvlB
MRPLHFFSALLLVSAPLLRAAPALACDDDDCDELTDDEHEHEHEHRHEHNHGGGTVSAGGQFDETRPAKPTGSVDVHLFSGSVHVTGWNQNFVNVKGTSDHDCRLLITPSGDRTEVGIECQDGPPDAELEVKVPQAGSVEVRTMSAPIEVHGVAGNVRVHTVAADVRVDGNTTAEVEARSTSGSIEVRTNSAYTRAHTVSGNVSVIGAHGRASLHSVSGECELTGGDFTEVSMQSVSGTLEFQGGLAPQASLEAQSHSGDVRLRVPMSTNAEVELRSFSGDLSIDVGGRKEGSRTLQARIGNGGAKIRAHSFSGDVTVTGQTKAQK